MKIGRWARLLLAAAPMLAGVLAGCGNFWEPPNGGGGGGGGTGVSSGIFYVLNQETSQIAGYSIVKGTLTPVTNSPYTLPGSAKPLAIAVAPNGAFLYVSTAGSGIYLYTIGSGGALTLGNSSGAISADLAASMQVDSTNSWLVEAGPNLTEVLAIAISPTTGMVTSKTEQTVALPAATVNQLAISPDNKNVFVALGSSGTEVIPFAATNSTPFGTASNIPLKGISAVSAAVDPSNRLLYIGEIAVSSGTSNTGGVRAFSYSSLPTQSEASGSPYASGGLAPYAIQPSADGNYVYVANRTVSGSSAGNISAFSFTATGTAYSLTALGSPVSAGTTPVGLAEDSLGNYLLVVDSGGSPDLEGYTMSAGALTSTLSSATGTDPVQVGAIAALP
jgi:6-phosphogluconolactonase (cycloisomerase 2 family)